jgi:hypothetical protein
MRAATLIKKFAILCHRWMGVAFCLLFAWWFLSGIFMMYWDYPDISPADRLQRAQSIDRSKIQLSAQEAWMKLGQKREPGGVALAMFDGRPVYRFSSGTTVFADNGRTQDEYPDDLLLRMASAWTSQPSSVAPSFTRIENITEPDQWTIAVRNRLPLLKYSFPDGQQVYVSPSAGEIVQYTTTGSRIGAYLGPIPHWLYFTPLRLRETLWSNLIIYASGIGTIMALLGLIVGIWMVSPAKKYRFEGVATSVPYTGPKRLHMILGLFFGIVACTWSFSGMLSMDPPFLNSDPKGAVLGNSGLSASARIQAALHPDPFHFSAYDAKTPQQALAQLEGLQVKELDFTSFDGQPVYLASIGRQQTRIIPVQGDPRSEFYQNRIFEIIARAAEPAKVVEKRLMTRYDAYYLDRHHSRPLPILFMKLDDPEHTQLYIDQRTGRTVEEHSDNDSFLQRWLYHGLHSLDFPWLYNYRPAWDIVVLTLMLGGLSLSVTAVMIGWQLLRRKLRS